MKSFIALWFGFVAFSPLFLRADQETVIDAEDRKIRERLTAKGFNCYDNALNDTAAKFEHRVHMKQHTIYYFAVIMGRGESSPHVAKLTLVNQRKSVHKIDFQNTPFGSEVSIKPNSEGEKLLKFELTQKTNYRMISCAIGASLYQIDSRMPVYEGLGNF